MIRRFIRWMAGFAVVAVLILGAFYQFDVNISRKPVADKDSEAPAKIAIDQQTLTDTSGDSGSGATAASGSSEGLGEAADTGTDATPALPSVGSVSKPDAGADQAGEPQLPRTAQPEIASGSPAASDPVDTAAQVPSQPAKDEPKPVATAPTAPSLETPEAPAAPVSGSRAQAVDNVASSPAPAVPLASLDATGGTPEAPQNPASDRAVEHATGAGTVAGTADGVAGLPSVGDQTSAARPSATGTLATLDTSGGTDTGTADGVSGIVVPVSKPQQRPDRQSPDLQGGAPSVSTPDLPAVSEPEPEDQALELAAVQPAQTEPARNEPDRANPTGQPKAPEQSDGSPVFDIVRVDRDGQTVIAGSTRPNEKVEVLLDGAVVGETIADATGQFVAIVFANLSGSAQRLELRSLLPADAAENAEAAPLSDIAPTVASNIGDLSSPVLGGEGAPSTPETGNADVARNQPAAGATGTVASPERIGAVAKAPPVQRHAVSAPVIILPAQEATGAPTLVQPRRDGLAMLQPPEREILGVVLDSISYDESGAVILSGRGVVERVIRIYANGEEAGAARVDPDGRWVWASEVADPQNIKLFRLDELGPEGSVTSRIETPFKYERFSPKLVRDREVEIQRGDMLWRIAEQFYGEGIRYSMIYGANSELIRDPDLIYPGQVFTIPELVDAN